eukprot:6624834-Prymnesium_polylepis.2
MRRQTRTTEHDTHTRTHARQTPSVHTHARRPPRRVHCLPDRWLDISFYGESILQLQLAAPAHVVEYELYTAPGDSLCSHIALTCWND